MPEDEKLTFKETVIKNVMTWLSAQPFSNIMLLIITVQITYAGYGLIWHTLPLLHSHAEETLKSINENHLKERKEIQDNHRSERRELIDFFDRWMRNNRSDIKTDDTTDSKVAKANGCN